MGSYIKTEILTDIIVEKYKFFAGVPDSVLKDFCSALSDRLQPNQFITAANEGNAIALCAGYTLATGKPGVVYMQNSGLGNAVNPLLSLNDALVYRIPVLLVIGWRGEPGVNDEPQHKKQGLITRELLDVCGIPWRLLSGDNDIDWADSQLKSMQSPVALLVRKGTLSEYRKIYANEYKLSREMAIETILDSLRGKEYLIVSTTGMISRELYALREKRRESHSRDFLTVGSMGHASSIAMGLALHLPNMKIVCLDGDGAALMHMGSMATIGASCIENIIHIVLNNASHDSVGGQPTIANAIDFPSIAKACIYSMAVHVSDISGLKQAISSAYSKPGRYFIEVAVALRGDTDLMRPPESTSKTPLDMQPKCER